MSAMRMDARNLTSFPRTAASTLSVDAGIWWTMALNKYDATSAPDSVAKTGPPGCASRSSAALCALHPSRIVAATSGRAEQPGALRALAFDAAEPSSDRA